MGMNAGAGTPALSRSVPWRYFLSQLDDRCQQPRYLSAVDGLPAMRQQFLNPAGPVHGQAREHVLELGIGSCPFMHTDWTRLIFAQAHLPRTWRSTVNTPGT